MSKIEKQLVDGTELSTKRGEDRQDFLKRLVKATSELSDKEWDKLSPEAQNWFNDAADAMNKKKELPDFPDAEKKEPETTVSRRGSKASEEKAPEPKVGDKVVIVTKRGKTIEGEIVEANDELLVIKDAEGETEVGRDRIESMTVKADEPKPSRRRSADDDGGENQDPPGDPKVGDKVEVKTKRGKVFTGKVVELDGPLLIVDDGEGEIEVDPEKCESITIKEAAAKEEKKAEKKEEKKKDEGGEKKRATAKANGGVSATGRMRELICEDSSISKEDLAAKLKKEGLEFRDNTLDLVYADTQKIISILKGLKKLK